MIMEKTPAQELWDRKRKLGELFGAEARGCIETIPTPRLFGRIDVVRLDDLLKKRHADYGENESMRDFITRKFGKEAANWVERNI
jgi:protoporphyrinogen oxidase